MLAILEIEAIRDDKDASLRREGVDSAVPKSSLKHHLTIEKDSYL
jgi:hypothetical protein